MNETEQRIREAALGLFAEKGFAATGIRELAERAGVNSATLYHYMGGKEALLARLMRDGNQRILSVAEKAVADLSQPEDRLATLTRVHVLAHALRQRETAVMDQEIGFLNRENYGPVVAIRDAYEKLWQEALEDGVARGTFDCADAKLARLGLLAMCTGVTYWFRPGGALSPDIVAHRFADLALATVRAQRDGEPLRVDQLAAPDMEHLTELLA